MYHFQGNQNTGPNNRPPRAFNFRHPPLKVSERPLLTAKHTSPEVLAFPASNAPDRFRGVEDLSDADEADTDMSHEGYPPKKMRWSNPDPYTSLPPLDDTTRKRKDVVKLIRKARVEPAATPKNSVANDQDFISFDVDGDDSHPGLHSPPAGAPRGPKSDYPARNVQPVQQKFQDSIQSGKRKREDTGNQFRLPPHRKQDNGDGMVLVQWQPTSNVSATPWLRSVNDKSLEPPGISLHKEILDFYEWIKPRDFEHEIRANLIARLQRDFERLEPGGRLKPFGSFAAGLYLPIGDMDLVFLRSSFRGTRISPTGKLQKPKIETLNTFARYIRNHGLAQGVVKPILHAKVPIIKFVERVSGLRVDLSFDNDTGVVANETFEEWKVQYPAMPILVSIIKHFLMMRGLNDVAFGGLGGFSIICLVTSLAQHLPSTGQPPNLGLMLLEFFNLYGNLFNRHDVAIRLRPPSYISKGGNTYLVCSKERPDCLSIIDPHRQDNNISAGTHEIQRIVDCFKSAHDILQRRLTSELGHSKRSGSLLEDILGGNFSAYERQRQSLYKLHIEMLQDSSAIPPPPPATVPSPRAPPPPPPSAVKSPRAVVVPVRQNLNREPLLDGTSRYNRVTSGSSTPNGMSKDQTEDQAKGRNARKAMNRALRFQELRPDILKVKSMTQLTLDEALKLGGYENAEEMQVDLHKRAKATGKNLESIKA